MKLAQQMAGECVAVRLRILNRAVSAIYDDALRPLGIKVSQMNILIAVTGFGAVKPADLCKSLYFDPSTLSRNAERMKAKGWIEFQPAEDGRSHMLAPTAKGAQLIKKAEPAWGRAQKEAEQLLGERGAGHIFEAGDRLMRKSFEESAA